MKTIAVVVFALFLGYFAWSRPDNEWTVVTGRPSGGFARMTGSESASPATEFIPPAEEPDEPRGARAEAAPAAPVAKKGPAMSGNAIRCTLGRDSRTLAIIQNRRGCRLSYKKHSRIETLAESLFGNRVCQQVRSKVISKLKSSGYSCT